MALKRLDKTQPKGNWIMKLNQLERIEKAMDILCSVFAEIDGIPVHPVEVLDCFIGDYISEEDFVEIEDYYAGREED